MASVSGKRVTALKRTTGAGIDEQRVRLFVAPGAVMVECEQVGGLPTVTR